MKLSFKALVLLFFILSSLSYAEEEPKKAEEAKPKKEATDEVSVKKELSITLEGKKLNYTVTAEKLVLKNEKGEERAAIFHFAYLLKAEQEERVKRPVLFAFNGGPGSSSVWLHMGALGPKIVPTTPEGTETTPPPYQVEDNLYTILPFADLVFVDPVSTGYSHVGEEGKASSFHGVNSDVASMADFVRRWLSENDRWASPKYLLGESYGGVRAIGLAAHLQEHFGMSLNGVVLLSSLIDFQALRFSSSNDLPYICFLPTYTACAHYHGKIKGERDALILEAQEFAQGAYAANLLKGWEVPAEKIESLSTKLSQLTGISAKVWKDCQLRLNPSRFRAELLRKEGKSIGRFDGRATSLQELADEDYPDFDPSYEIPYGAFATGIMDYMTRHLELEEYRPYKILNRKVHPWKWDAENRYLDKSADLVKALQRNKHLRVLVMCGATDLATPPGNIEYSIRHLLRLPAERHRNISFTYYDAGHMFYLNEPDLQKLQKDLKDFLK